jgi:hypothetical protein
MKAKVLAMFGLSAALAALMGCKSGSSSMASEPLKMSTSGQSDCCGGADCAKRTQASQQQQPPKMVSSGTD